MYAIIKITIRDLLFRLEHIAVQGIGVLFILLFGIFYVSDTLAEQVLTMAAASSPGSVPLPRDILVSTMFLFGEFFITIIALFTVPQLLVRDEQQNTLPLFLTKPLPRWHYFFGKYLGEIASLCISFGIYSVIILLFVIAQSPALVTVVMLSSLFVMLKLALFSALIIGFAERYFRLFGVLTALLLYITGHMSMKMLELSYLYEGMVGQMMKTAYYILPDLAPISSWSIISAAVENYPLHIDFAYWFIKHTGLYTCGFLLLGYASFKKKSF